MIADAAELKTGQSQEGIEPATGPVPRQVAKDLVQGTSALGLGLIIERGLGFLANLLAARLGGASTFGAYSLALSTANNISSYAAGGIGSTAVRFSGRYSRDSAGYSTLSRVLAIISLVSAALAMAILWAGAGPISRLLGKQSLSGLLHWTALSAAGIILLECCRGFLVGQRRLPAILLLSLTVGIGLISLLPITAKLGAVSMIASQGAVALGAVALCAVLYRPLGLAATGTIQRGSVPLSPMLREVWSFGLVQLAGLVGMNAAGWWLTTLVARSDTSLVQMGYFAVAHQLRNIVALAPALLTESSLAVMAQGESKVEKTPDQVMAVCTVATTFASLLVAGVGMVLVPWGLRLLYGNAYIAASATTAAALATAVVHMGSAPASARLSIVSIKMTGVINTIWAVMVAAGAMLFFFIGGNASKGAVIYLAAHLVSAVLVLSFLTKRQCVPRGMNRIFVTGATASVVLAILAFWRYQRPDLMLSLTILMALISCGALWTLVAMGRRHGWIPSFNLFVRALQTRGGLRWLTR
jgi:O-antigen/teichoic acid export membrane protein